MITNHYVKSGIYCKAKNTTTTIISVNKAYSVGVGGEFLLEWYECFGKTQGWYINYALQLTVVHQLRMYKNLSL